MDKLKLDDLGGFPLDLNDLDWLQLALSEAVKGLSAAFGNNYILSGCEITGVSLVDITAGWVVINGEPCYHPAQTGISLPGGFELYSHVLEESGEPGGDETFQDLSVVNSYLRRRATGKQLTAFANGAMIPNVPLSGPRLSDQVSALVGSVLSEPWRVLEEAGQPVLENNWSQGSGVNKVMFRKEAGGLVRLKGILNGTASTDTIAFTLPAGYRPASFTKSVRARLTKDGPSIAGAEERAAFVTSAGSFLMELTGGADGRDIFNLSEFPAFVAEN